jgi:3-oxoacyl-[acyl-carrier-protein] synthase II
MDEAIAPRMACLIGSALNGSDAFRVAMHDLEHRGPLRVSPYLLPNLCANLPSGKAGMLLKFTGPIFSPQGACASGNHAIGIGARMIRDGDCDFVLAGGADAPILPELIHGFANMNPPSRCMPMIVPRRILRRRRARSASTVGDLSFRKERASWCWRRKKPQRPMA